MSGCASRSASQSTPLNPSLVCVARRPGQTDVGLPLSRSARHDAEPRLTTRFACRPALRCAGAFGGLQLGFAANAANAANTFAFLAACALALADAAAVARLALGLRRLACWCLTCFLWCFGFLWCFAGRTRRFAASVSLGAAAPAGDAISGATTASERTTTAIAPPHRFHAPKPAMTGRYAANSATNSRLASFLSPATAY